MNEPQIGPAIGRIPSGCAILTVTHQHHATGMLVSWVQQASFAPPCITVAIRGDRPAVALLEASGRFVLNVVGEAAAPMLKHFGRGFAPDEDAFAGIAHQPSDFGPLLPDCIAHLGCERLSVVPVADHQLFVARVNAAALREGARPYVHIRKTGLSY